MQMNPFDGSRKYKKETIQYSFIIIFKSDGCLECVASFKINYSRAI